MTILMDLLRGVAGRVLGGLALAGGVLLAIMGMKRHARREGREEATARHQREDLKEALDEQTENAERLGRMRDARSDGPHGRDAVVERLRDGDA